jgi:hypothetical protein
MQTGLVQEWSGKGAFKQASGLSKHTSPDSCVGAQKMLSTGKRFFCFLHKTMETVVSVQSIEQYESKTEYLCTMSCECQRVIGISVQRTPSGLDALRESKARAADFRSRHELIEIEPLDTETAEIRADMKDQQLD